MNENKRFTRSSASALRNSHSNGAQIKQLQDIELKIKKATMDKQYKQALSLVGSLGQENHWTSCKKANLLFEMGRTPRSLNAFRTALKFQRNNCVQCLKLLLKIIERSQPYIKPFEKDIQNCLAIENLPSKMKAQFTYLLGQIETQYDSSSSLLQQRGKMQQFTSYYTNKGLMFKKVELVEIQEQYRYARAKSTIKANEVIIFVPQKQMITLQMAKQYGQISKLSGQESKFKSPKHSILSTFLLVHMEKGQESPYYNYIQCLPKKMNNFPIYYSDELIKELKGTYFESLILRKKQDIREDYTQLMIILPELAPIVTYEKFIWARMVVSSRIFGVVMSGKKTDALVPIADMLNHKIPKMTSWYFSDQKRGFIVQNSDQEICKGDQIFDSYGYKCNSRFLLNYGFTMHQNACNQVLIVLEKRTSKSLGVNFKLTTDISSQEFKAIIRYLRHSQVLIDRAQGSNHQTVSKSEGFISDQNQCSVWKRFQKILKVQFSGYQTLIKTDEKLLRSTDPSQFNLRNCIVIRLGEKRVLDYYLKMSKKMVEYFSLKRKSLDVKEYETYLKEVREFSGLPGE